MTDHDIVEVRVRIAARPETVFKFISDPDRVRQWLGDASIGHSVGEAILVRYPDGGAARGNVEEIVADRRVVFSWGYDGDKFDMPPGSTRVSIDLAPIPSGTLVTLRHTGIPGDVTRRQHRMGWRHYVSTLGTAAASVAGIAEPAIDVYHAAWGETDSAKRRALLDRCWAADAIFRDAMGYAEGRDELSDYIAGAQRFSPNVAFERVGDVRHAHGFVHYGWRFRAPDG
ncbi:MAG: SRPBCC family protein, partial [bacterium]